jgi:thymidine kinase
MFAGKTTELLRRIERARAQGLRVLPVKPMRDTRYSEGHLVTHTGVRIDARRVASLAEFVDELLAQTPAARVEPIDTDSAEWNARGGSSSGSCIVSSSVSSSTTGRDMPRETTRETAHGPTGHTRRDTPRASPPIDLVAIDEIHFFSSEAVAPIDALRALGVRVVVAGCDLDHFGEVFAPFDALLPRACLVTRLTGTCARCGDASTHSERTVAATERIIVGGAAEFVATCASCFRPSRREHEPHGPAKR